MKNPKSITIRVPLVLFTLLLVIANEALVANAVDSDIRSSRRNLQTIYSTKDPTSSPTGPPVSRPESCGEESIHFYLNLKTDDYGKSDTSFLLVDALSGQEIEKFSNFESNQSYKIEKCLQCSQYNFTIFDKYGDGIFYPGGFSLVIDDEYVESSWTGQNQETNEIGFALSKIFSGAGNKCSLAPSSAPTAKPSVSSKPTFITTTPSTLPSEYPSTHSSAPSSVPTEVVCNNNEINIILSLLTDTYEFDTSVVVMNVKSNQIFFQKDDNQLDRRTKHDFNICAPCGSYELAINDSYGDGIDEPGGYSLTVDGIVVVSDGKVIGFGISITFGTDECTTENPSVTPSTSTTPPPSVTPSTSTTPPPSVTPSVSATPPPSVTPSASVTPLPSVAPSTSPALCKDNQMHVAVNVLTDGNPHHNSIALMELSTDHVVFYSKDFKKEEENVFSGRVRCGMYKMFIFDSLGDGIQEPGGFIVFLDGLIDTSTGLTVNPVSGHGSMKTLGKDNCMQYYPSASPSS